MLTFAQADMIAESFHSQYEHIAKILGYKTREESSVDWNLVPTKNRELMRQTMNALFVETKDGLFVFDPTSAMKYWLPE